MVSSMSRFWCSSSSTVSCVILRSPSSFLFTFSTSGAHLLLVLEVVFQLSRKNGTITGIRGDPSSKVYNPPTHQKHTGPHACEFFCSRESVCFLRLSREDFPEKAQERGTSCIIKKNTNDKQFSRIDAFNFCRFFLKLGIQGTRIYHLILGGVGWPGYGLKPLFNIVVDRFKKF